MASGGGGGRRRRKPRRRSRPKARKPKYLSLRRHLAPAPPPSSSPPSPPSPPSPSLPPPPDTPSPEPRGGAAGNHHLELNVASTLFAAAPSLTDILGSSASFSAADESSSSASRRPPHSGEEDLARRALRGRERWVYCSSSTATSSSSSSSSSASPATAAGGGASALWLKLDYDEILAAWSDRGSLYIGGCGAQVVPELDHYRSDSPVFVEVGQAAAAATWSVPETGGEGKGKGKEREASVRRYKEKRQSRLFAKRIRYEVRKLNAEKRPRLKGRFVKAKEDVQISGESELQQT